MKIKNLILLSAVIFSLAFNISCSKNLKNNHELKLTKNGWETTLVMVGDAVRLSAEINNIKDGADIKFAIFRKETKRTDTLLRRINAKAVNGRAEVKWKCEVENYDKLISGRLTGNEAAAYEKYFFYFIIEDLNGNKISGPGRTFEMRDWVEFSVSDDDGLPKGGRKYVLIFEDGSMRTGLVSESGYIYEEFVPIGKFRLVVDGINQNTEVVGSERRGDNK